MNRADEYTKRLNKAAKALMKKPLTSVELAKRLKCSKPTAYSLIQELLRRGVQMDMRITRVGSRGPQAHSFLVTGWPEEEV